MTVRCKKSWKTLDNFSYARLVASLHTAEQISPASSPTTTQAMIFTIDIKNVDCANHRNPAQIDSIHHSWLKTLWLFTGGGRRGARCNLLAEAHSWPCYTEYGEWWITCLTSSDEGESQNVRLKTLLVYCLSLSEWIGWRGQCPFALVQPTEKFWNIFFPTFRVSLSEWTSRKSILQLTASHRKQQPSCSVCSCAKNCDQTFFSVSRS